MAEETTENGPSGLHQLIGTSLAAVVRAQTYIARITTGFVEHVGLTGHASNHTSASVEDTQQHELGALRMVSFQYERPGSNGVLESLKVPLLSLVHPPIKHLAEATIDFYADIHGITSAPPGAAPQETNGTQIQHTDAAPKHLGLIGKISPSPKEADERNGAIPQMRIQIKLSNSELPSGFNQLFAKEPKRPNENSEPVLNHRSEPYKAKKFNTY